MSGKFSSALIFISAVAVAVAANLADDSSRTGRSSPHAGRGMASIPSSKEALLGEFKPTLATNHTEKVHGGIYVKIELNGAKPEHVGDVFVMRGEIRTEDGNLNSVDFKWSLPSGVRLLNGQVSGMLSSLTPGQPAVVELTLEKTSDKNEQVHLMAGATRGSSRFAESAQYNTDVQEQLNAERAAVRSGLKASSAAERKAIKVFH